MALDTLLLACETGLLPSRERRAHRRAARAARLPALGRRARRSRPDGRPAVLDGPREFREHLGGELTVTLLARHRPRRRGAPRCDARPDSLRARPRRDAGRAPGTTAADEARVAGRRTSRTAPTSIPARAWPRCARNLERARGARASAAWRRTGPSASGCGCRRARPTSWREPAALAAFRAFLADARALRVHDQRLSVRRVPRRRASRRASTSRTGASDERRRATATALAELLAALLPRRRADGSISTVPGAFKRARARTRTTRRRSRDQLLRARGARCTRSASAPARRSRSRSSPSRAASSRRSTRRSRSSSASVRSAGRARLAALTGLGAAQREAALRRHLGVCFDACHAAVEFEDARDGARRAARAPASAIAKIQLSAGLRVATLAGDRRAARPRSRASPTTSTCTRWSSARRRPLHALPRPAGGARGARRGDARRARVARSTSTCRSSAQQLGRVRQHAAVPRASCCAQLARAARSMRRTSRSRRTPGTCCRRGVPRPSRRRRRDRARAALGCMARRSARDGAGMKLVGRATAARPRLEPADGLDQRARRRSCSPAQPSREPRARCSCAARLAASTSAACT